MNNTFDDIIEAAGRNEPLWHDRGGIPRFATFHPKWMANIYAREAFLLKIRCQACHAEFLVCDSGNAHRPERPLAEQLEDGTHSWGDPPNTGCCRSGPSMTSETLEVVEWWVKNPDFRWEQKQPFKIPHPDAHV